MKGIAVLLVLFALCFTASAATDELVAPLRADAAPSVVHHPALPTDAVTIPQVMSYQGRLTDTLGQPVPTGNYALTFRLYTVPAGGSAFWTEPQTVMVKNGLFSALLGTVTPITSVPDAGTLYLGLQVAADPELSPRLRIGSAAYAYRADTANYAYASAGGGSDSAWVRQGADSVLYTVRRLGVARGGAGNVLYGSQVCTHINFGSACTTGTSGQNNGYGTIGGGQGNAARGNWSTVSGGALNKAVGDGAAIAGGGYNLANGVYTFVGGGSDDTARANWSAVVGGNSNEANGLYSFIGGGYWNGAHVDYTFVGGGAYNGAAGYYATVAGGNSNHADANYCAIGGGNGNYATDTFAFIGGGVDNAASGTYSTIGGGHMNTASMPYTAVAGGDSNRATGTGSFVGGGRRNLASTDYTTVAGGRNMIVNSLYGGGLSGSGNIVGGTAFDSASCVAGGWSNDLESRFGFIGGGRGNFVSVGGQYGVIGGGQNNRVSSNSACVGGGASGRASGDFASIAGGLGDTVAGKYGFAAGLHSIVRSADTNSVAFNGTTTSGHRQTRVYSLGEGFGALCIDHPLDPKGKILNQYTMASSEMVLFYRGKATVGSNGRITVSLPEYFDALCCNPMVQLTGVGTSDVFVEEKVVGNHFGIGGKPGTEVYWTVTAERNDPVAEQARADVPVEQAKSNGLQGRSVNGLWK